MGSGSERIVIQELSGSGLVTCFFFFFSSFFICTLRRLRTVLLGRVRTKEHSTATRLEQYHGTIIRGARSTE